MNPSTSPMFVAHLIICVVLFISINQCISQTIQPMDENLIRQTCKATPDYNLCLFLLKAKGGKDIYNASRARMAEIMTDIVISKTTEAYNKTLELLKTTPTDRGLHYCKDQYLFITSKAGPSVKRNVYAKVPGARDMMQKLVINKVHDCEVAYGLGKTALTEYNNNILKVAYLARAIIDQL